MSDYSVTVDGIEDLVKRLDIAGGPGGNVIKDAMELSAFQVREKVQVYPPKPAASSYVRTGDLRKHWGYEVSDDGFEAKIGNAIEYAPYVQGRSSQVWYHKRTGWKTAESVLDAMKDNIQKIFVRLIQARLDGKA